jgi:hypothetical protein
MWASQHQIRHYRLNVWAVSVVLSTLFVMALPFRVHAITRIPTPPPGAGSYGLVATKTQPAPTTAATISTPSSGASYSTSPITVSGLCTNGLLVQVYDNEVLAGAINCVNGSFTLQVSLFTGTNDITATQFDDLDQPGPDSNKVTVTYDNASFSAFGALVTLTSNYARRAANPGSTLSWPLLLSGGTGPYAFSIDWGDGSAADLKSQALAGEVDINHVYDKSGIYHVTVKVTDANGVSAFLQLVAIANGTPTNTGSTSGSSKGGTVTVTKVLWIPAVICLVLLLPTYWLGRRSELVTLHKQLEKNMANYKEL